MLAIYYLFFVDSIGLKSNISINLMRFCFCLSLNISNLHLANFTESLVVENSLSFSLYVSLQIYIVCNYLLFILRFDRKIQLASYYE